MKARRIGLFYGGTSVEHEVSQLSAQHITTRLQECDYKVLPFYISKTGDLLYREKEPVTLQMGSEMPFTTVDGRPLSFELAFPLIHGFGGEDGSLQGLFELAGINYIGCKVAASALGMHKDLTKRVAQTLAIPTTPSVLFHSQQLARVNWQNLVESLNRKLGQKLLLKPNDGGSSVGVTVITSLSVETLRAAVAEVQRYSEQILIEQYLEGIVEIECAILEEKDNLIVSEPALVVNPTTGDEGFLNYQRKYALQGGAYLQIPAPFEKSLLKTIGDYALRLAQALQVEGFARVDFFYHPESNAIYLNEINTIPGMTATSHWPLMMVHSGYSWHQIFDLLCSQALKSRDFSRSYQGAH